jgi:putative addiction module component (TIGR02574 family)
LKALQTNPAASQWLQRVNRADILQTMKLAEIEQEALALTDQERASLVAKLLDTLPLQGTEVSDDEVERREQELESGQVAAISHDEFVRRVQQERRR